MGELCPAGFKQKGPQVGRVFLPQFFLGEPPVAQERSSVGKIGLPMLNPKIFLVERAFFLPIANSKQPALRVKPFRGKADHKVDNAQVDDEPDNDIDDDRPEGWDVDEPHLRLPSLVGADGSPLPLNFPKKKGSEEGEKKNDHEKEEGNGK